MMDTSKLMHWHIFTLHSELICFDTNLKNHSVSCPNVEYLCSNSGLFKLDELVQALFWTKLGSYQFWVSKFSSFTIKGHYSDFSSLCIWYDVEYRTGGQITLGKFNHHSTYSNKLLIYYDPSWKIIPCLPCNMLIA